MANTRDIGAAYEQCAADYLQQKGCRILAKNFRCRQGEIDLVVEDAGTLVFIEVKYRKDAQTGEPQEAVGFYKQKKISRAASYYCVCHQVPQDHPCRFDVLAICGSKITWIKNAFDYVE